MEIIEWKKIKKKKKKKKSHHLQRNWKNKTQKQERKESGSCEEEEKEKEGKPKRNRRKIKKMRNKNVGRTEGQKDRKGILQQNGKSKKNEMNFIFKWCDVILLLGGFVDFLFY